MVIMGNLWRDAAARRLAAGLRSGGWRRALGLLRRFFGLRRRLRRPAPLQLSRGGDRNSIFLTDWPLHLISKRLPPRPTAARGTAGRMFLYFVYFVRVFRSYHISRTQRSSDHRRRSRGMLEAPFSLVNHTSPLRDDLGGDAAAASAFRLISSASFMISSTRRSWARRARAKQKHARRNPAPATARTTTAIVSSNAAGLEDRFLFADGGAVRVGRGVGAGTGSQRRTVKSTVTSTSARPPFGQ